MDAPIRKEPNFLGRLIGKRINIVLNSDDEIGGVLKGYSRYEILLLADKTDLEEATTILVMKHAINIIIPDEEGVFDRKEEVKQETAYAGTSEEKAIDAMK